MQPYEALAKEKQKVLDYALKHPELRHRELAWRMVDEDVVCLSPSTVYRVLSAEVRSRVPDLEIETPQRNSVLLSTLAKRSGGEYYAGLEAATNGQTIKLTTQLNNRPADQITYLPGTPDKPFDERLMLWLLGAIVGVLAPS